MKKFLISILCTMAVVAVVYCNYHALKDSVPFLQRQRDRLMQSKPYVKVANWIKGTKTKVSDVGSRVVHIFKRKTNVA